MITDLNLIIAIATARIFVGILFFFQGYDKIFNIGMKQLRQTMSANLGNHKLPDSFIGVVAISTSWIELLGGFLLIIGFFKYFALYLLCIDLLIVALASILILIFVNSNKKHQIKRWHGGLLLLVYAIYLGWMISKPV